MHVNLNQGLHKKTDSSTKVNLTSRCEGSLETALLQVKFCRKANTVYLYDVLRPVLSLYCKQLRFHYKGELYEEKDYVIAYWWGAARANSAVLR